MSNNLKIIRKIYRRICVGKRTLIPAATQEEIDRLFTLPEGNLLNHETRAQEIIISLTSFPPRLQELHLVIRSILLQTMRPDKVKLYLGSDVNISSLPLSLTELEQHGLEIIKRSGNLKPHKKYYYAIQENPEAIVITVDDDLIYPVRMIEELMSVHERFPDCVVASRAHKILFDRKGNIEPYNEWEWEYWKTGVPSLDLLATGGAGALYPPHCMDERLFDLELIQDLSPNADDLWLKVMQVLKGTRVVLCDQEIRRHIFCVTKEQKESLQKSNVHQNMNDVYLGRLLQYFKLSRENFM